MLRLRKSRSGVYRCYHCDWLVDDQAEPWKATCPVCPTIAQQSFVMVGDLVERVLSFVGITKAFAEKITRTEGKPGGCGCARRQKWMNDSGVRLQKKAAKILLAVRQFYLPR